MTDSDNSARLRRIARGDHALDRKVAVVEKRWGHPADKRERLVQRIQANAIKSFLDIAEDFLDLIWTLDQYRVAQVPPRAMGRLDLTPARRLEGVYRGKGNNFSTLIALLLGQQTSQILAPRSRVQGFSQEHQIDVAWPARDGTPIPDPLICVETKLTGAPAYGTTPARGAMSDWSNRRKELKFAATDLKLNRRQAETSIDHWDFWRRRAAPSVYFLWCARLQPRDRVEKMMSEAQALSSTYLDGAGMFAYRTRAGDDGYEPVPITPSPTARVTSVDDVLQQIAAEIKEIIRTNGGSVPPPILPQDRVVDVNQLEPDREPPE